MRAAVYLLLCGCLLGMGVFSLKDGNKKGARFGFILAAIFFIVWLSVK
jgi:hypothetical protein